MYSHYSVAFLTRMTPPCNVSQALEKLLSTSRKLSLLAVLSNGQINRATDAKRILTTIQTSERRKKYRLFLHDVLRECGPAAVLVCALGLGQGRITDLTDLERTNLCHLISENKNVINHPTIEALAAANQIPMSVDDIPLLLPSSQEPDIHKQPNKRRRLPNRTTETTTDLMHDLRSGLEVHQRPIHVPSLQEQRVIENATIEGTKHVFGEELCRAVRKVYTHGQTKASVTTVLPKWGGPVDCLISLDIREEEVDQLALALFNAKVTWVQQGLHVVLRDGFTIILTCAEAEVTLKGATDKAIVDVFGSQTCDAVNESRIRKREWEAGEQLTHCVSMIITKSGAIISISLSLESGIQIQNMLYT